jgi:putative chitinase
MITSIQFKRLFPGCPAAKAALYLQCLICAMLEFEIITRERVAAFAAQVGHESQDLRCMREIWQGGPSQGTAAQHRYDVRADLGNTPERDGDGFTYRGRGWLETTGKGNYRRVSHGLGLGELLVERPELLEQPTAAARSAGFFWKDNRINRVCDGLNGTGNGADIAQLDKVSKIVNGGTNGRDDRRRRYKVALAVLGTDSEFAAAVATFKQGQTATAGAGSGVRSQESGVQSTITSSGRSEGQETPEKGIPEATGDPQNASQGTPQTANSADFALLDEIPINDTTKGIGRATAMRAGKTFARPAAILSAALAAGNVWAWAALVVVVGGLGWLAWVHRDDVRRLFLSIMRKVKSGQ